MTAGAHLAAALAREAGFCPVPVASNGTKMPGLSSWRRYVATSAAFTGELPTSADLAEWFEHGNTPGLGLVCGHISGGLEMLEVEGRFVESVPEVRATLASAGLGNLFERIDAGYREVTPSGGIHWLYRCDEIEGNRKLAQKPAADRPNGRDVLIETRGEGGFVVIAPTAGVFDDYPDGAKWQLQRGGFATVATITADERRDLFAVLASFDEMPEHETVPAPTVLDRRQTGQLDDDERPGDEYNRSTTWHDLLGADGWTPVFQRGDAVYWRRPGKSSGISATTNALGTDRLKVFTTSTSFDPDRTYDRFGAYALLRHNGDLQGAARTIRPAPVVHAVARTVLEGPRVPTSADEGSAAVTAVPAKHIDELLGENEEPYDWLIPDLLERGDRLIVTAPEGLGKSTLLRQIAMAGSIGQHPFGGADLERPLKALIVDLENSERQIKRQLRPLREAANRRPELYLKILPAGINIQSEVDRAEIERTIAYVRPDILVIGPVYKMSDGDPNDEVSAKPVAMELDRLRTIYGFAVLMEHHQPYGDNAKKRPLRPVGWSGWSRWPEFGLALVGEPDDPEVEVKRWRGDRDARKWPAKLAKYGNPWPFAEAVDNRVSWVDMVGFARSHSTIVPAVIAAGLGIPVVQVDNAIKANRPAWDQLVQDVDPF